MTKDEIAKILKQLRIDAELTQKEAAEAIGRKQQTLASWETGQSQPDANTLFILCRKYGTTVDRAFGFTESNSISQAENALIKKYRKLDSYGKEMIDMVLEKEYERCAPDQPDYTEKCREMVNAIEKEETRARKID